MAVLNVAVDLHNTVGSGKEFQSEMVRGKKEFLNMSLLQLYTLIDLEFLFLDGRGLNAIWGSVGIATRPLMILKSRQSLWSLLRSANGCHLRSLSIDVTLLVLE